MKRLIVYTALSLLAAVAYCLAAWAAAGGDDRGILVLLLVLLAVTGRDPSRSLRS